MCGRMALTRSGAEIAEYFALTAAVGTLTAPDGTPLGPRYNIAPSQEIPTILFEPETGRRCEWKRWGLVPSWAKDQALAALNVQEIAFDTTDGNCLGFARERSIAINPVNPMPHKTRFHELAHVLLGHTAEGLQADTPITPKNLRECEAEAVALLCCAALDLPGVQECRGYVQHWWGQGHEIPERSAQRILKTADQILKAGTTDATAGTKGGR